MKTGPSRNAAIAALGLLLGFSLSQMGFTDYDQLHAMFTFADLRLFLVFVGALGLTAVGLRFVARVPGAAAAVREPRAIHPGTVAGGVVFGLGWALSGACPGVLFAQVGEGRALALFSFAGAALGTVSYRFVHARFFKWDRHQC